LRYQRFITIVARLCLATVWYVLFAAFVAPVQGGDAGRVFFQKLAAPALDRWTNAPSTALQRWFQNHFARMAVFSPYFDGRTSWYRNGLVYVNLYGIPTDSAVVRAHPEWILHDVREQRLYIPWNCSKGVCPQYAGDIASPAFRSWWIGQTQSAISRGTYRGLWIDDVNMEFRVSDGSGRQVPPLDSSARRPMTGEEWRNHVAEFLEQIRRAFPASEIVHNAIWFAGPDSVRDRDDAIRRQIKAADNINIERGIASDPGLTGGTDKWSVFALLGYIDRVHAAGRSVTLEEYFLNGAAREYALAGYFLISSGNDRFDDSSADPSNWWNGYDVKLGTPLGPRTYADGVFRRSFTHGLVLLAEPMLQPQKIPLYGHFTTLDGIPLRSVMLTGGQGIILTASN
jgi:Hypothetical glycosyl hydrolase family 15